MLGKALSLTLVAALITVGAVQASTLSRVWEGHVARGGDLSFLRAGKRIHDVRAQINVTCTNEVESTQRTEMEQLEFDKIVRLGAGGHLRTTQQYSSSFERWTMTWTGALGATKASGTIAWTYEKTSNAGFSCKGKGSSRWTARRGRPVADPLP